MNCITVSNKVDLENFKSNNFNFYNELAKMDSKEKGIDEVCHSKIIAWLLQNNKFFLYNFLFFIKYCDISNVSAYKFDDLVVKTEENNIDIILYSHKNNFVCAIENKIDGKLQRGQLSKYVKVVEENFPHFDKKYVYLRRYFKTLCSSDEKQIKDNNYIEMEYSDIAKFIDKTVLNQYNFSSRAYFNIIQYKEFLDLYWYDTIDVV